jgi:hypothetical protein
MKFVNWFMRVTRIVIHYQEVKEDKVYNFHRFNYKNPLGWILLTIVAVGVGVVDGLKSTYEFMYSVLRND